MTLAKGNAKEGSSTSIASNPHIKTYKTHKNLQSEPKAIEVIFGGIFKISKNQRNSWGIFGGNKVKSMATVLLIPYDKGVTL